MHSAVMLACAMAHANMTMYIKYFLLLFTARYTHPKLCPCSASWGWASYTRNMSGLWDLIKWKWLWSVSSWCVLLNYVYIMMHGQQNIKFQKPTWEIWDSHSSDAGDSILLECDPVSLGEQCPPFRKIPLPPSSELTLPRRIYRKTQNNISVDLKFQLRT
jgi:hypothetical protein